MFEYKKESARQEPDASIFSSLISYPKPRETSTTNNDPSAQEVANLLNGRRIGRAIRCTCPVCKLQNSLEIGDGDTRLLVTCWKSDCDRADILREIRRISGCGSATVRWQPRQEPVRRSSETDLTRLVKRICSESTRISQGDPAYLYLASRGLESEVYPEALRFHPACRLPSGVREINPELPERLPALIAKFESQAGELVAVHRIYLTPDGKKAPFSNPKRILAAKPGCLAGGAIKLCQPNDQLAIAEGVETALSISGTLPVWATYSASIMPSVVIPVSVKELVICADNDHHGKGQEAANKLAQRVLSERRDIEVKILIPSKPGTDWLDELNGV